MIEIPGEIMVNSVDIYHALATQDKDGGPQYPEIPSLLGIPCSCQPREVDEMIDEQNRITMVQYYHVFFNSDPGIRARDKMIYQDARGNQRTIFCRATRDEGGQMAYFVVRAIEKI